MELWIRSQDRETLMKVNRIDISDTDIICYDCYSTETYMGNYSSKERTLEILDEIQSKIKNQFIVQANTLLKPDDLKTLKSIYDRTNKIDSIVSDQIVTVTPINADIVIYEMPKE